MWLVIRLKTWRSLRYLHQLTDANLGNSSNEAVGDGVIAIGNALGQFQNTVTQGIISGTDRSITASDSSADSMSSSEALSDLFQTDAAINPGNSGGPLISTTTGDVIGIDTATSSDGQDLGFAIPINEAKTFVAPLREPQQQRRLIRVISETSYVIDGNC